ncbi:thioredoxin domain-containing protein [Micromonospora musae]|uniref:DsbA family protein n=1 Tax=Micromonospora musae TaxID=1894970 RepID=UPI0033CC3185
MSSRRGQKRTAAKVVQQQLARERRRRRTIWVSVTAVAVVLIAGLIGWGVWSSQKSDDFTAPKNTAEGGTGVVVGSGPVTVDIYEDFLCPVCKQFQDTTGATVDQLINEGKIRAVYHPVAYLNRFSTTEYSTRSSAASGCAADEGRFAEYAKALYQQQPPEGSAGLTDDKLIDIGAGVGLNRDDFGSCVRDSTFKAWTEHVTDTASRNNVTGTPTVIIDGEQVADRSPDGIRAAVEAAGK